MTAMDHPIPPSPAGDDCGGCALADSRRAFLRDALAAVAGFAALGLAPRVALALPVGWVEALTTRGPERSYPLPAADGVQIDRDNGVVLARAASAVYALSLTCPHQNTALRWQAADGRFQCPKHKSKYRPDGVFLSGRATRSMDRFAIRRDGALVVVTLDRLLREDEQREQWRAAAVAL